MHVVARQRMVVVVCLVVLGCLVLSASLVTVLHVTVVHDRVLSAADLVHGVELVGETQEQTARRLAAEAAVKAEEEALGRASATQAFVDDDSGDASDEGDASVWRRRRDAVKNEMEFAWSSYRKSAWGSDDLKPVSGTPQQWMGMGGTIVDSLDTLWLMGLREEFAQGVEWLRNRSSLVTLGAEYPVFEVTIRIVGGLLSAYQLSGEKVLLERARQVADVLMPAILNHGTGVPYGGAVAAPDWSPPNPSSRSSLLAEVGTLQLEFLTLAKETGDVKYADAVLHILKQIDETGAGLLPTNINPQTGLFTGMLTMGAMSDSYYEYLLKLDLLVSQHVPHFRRMYERASTDAVKRLYMTSRDGYAYLAEVHPDGNGVNHRMQHLTCFAGGMFALGAQTASMNEYRERDMAVARELTRTCRRMQTINPTGLGSEWMSLDGDGADGHYMLRPEIVESFYYMWKFTKDVKYRQWAWSAFVSIRRYCRTPGGYSGYLDAARMPSATHRQSKWSLLSLDERDFQSTVKKRTRTNQDTDVRSTSTRVSQSSLKQSTARKPYHFKGMEWDDHQESFFLAETLKYLWLTFVDDDDEVLDLKEWVFNTEAHPFRVWNERDAASWLKYVRVMTK